MTPSLRHLVGIGCRCLVVLLCVGMLAGAADKKGTAKGDTEEETQEPERFAYNLGQFTIKNFRPVEREKVVLTFTVYAEVEEENNEQFAAMLPARENRVRNQIITTARLVTPIEYDDPKLEAFRRRIYLRLRRATPELVIHEIYISDFSYILE